VNLGSRTWNPRTGRLMIYIAAVISLAIWAGCGSDDDSGGSAGASANASPECDGMATLKIAGQPTASFAPIHLGLKKGFFKEENINLDVGAVAASGAEALAAVVAGKDDIGFADWVTFLQATGKGLPLRAVAPAASAGTDPDKAYIAVMSAPNSDITKPEQLAGKRIAVNALNNINQVATQAALKQRGIDIDGLKFIVVPYTETQAALEKGDVDASFMVEPLLGIGLTAGDPAVLYPTIDVLGDASIATYFTSTKTLSERKCVIDRFVKAINKSSMYAAQNPDEVRQVLTEYTDIPPDAVKNIRIPFFAVPFRAGAEKLGEAMVSVGQLEEMPDLDELIAYPDPPTN
jgi:NitT/TauT family transport system substrate-binding protein